MGVLVASLLYASSMRPNKVAAQTLIICFSVWVEGELLIPEYGLYGTPFEVQTFFIPISLFSSSCIVAKYNFMCFGVYFVLFDYVGGSTYLR